jgi:hypothetical protein
MDILSIFPRSDPQFENWTDFLRAAQGWGWGGGLSLKKATKLPLFFSVQPRTKAQCLSACTAVLTI